MVRRDANERLNQNHHFRVTAKTNFRMKTRKVEKKSRTTLAKKIRSFIQDVDGLKSMQPTFVATYERELSDLEDFCRQFYLAHKRVEREVGKKSYLFDHEFFLPTKTSKAAKREYEEWEKRLCEIFIKATIAHDCKTITELANAAQFFKGKLDSTFTPVDLIRQKLLRLKISSVVKRPRTIRQIAEYLNGGKPVETEADGNSALRRKCDELCVPYRTSRKIRKK